MMISEQIHLSRFMKIMLEPLTATYNSSDFFMTLNSTHYRRFRLIRISE